MARQGSQNLINCCVCDQKGRDGVKKSYTSCELWPEAAAVSEIPPHSVTCGCRGMLGEADSLAVDRAGVGQWHGARQLGGRRLGRPAAWATAREILRCSGKSMAAGSAIGREIAYNQGQFIYERVGAVGIAPQATDRAASVASRSRC